MEKSSGDQKWPYFAIAKYISKYLWKSPGLSTGLVPEHCWISRHLDNLYSTKTKRHFPTWVRIPQTKFGKLSPTYFSILSLQLEMANSSSLFCKTFCRKTSHIRHSDWSNYENFELDAF